MLVLQFLERKLLEQNLISEFDDIFTLKKGDLLELEGFAEKSADGLLSEIENVKKVEHLMGVSAQK